MALKHLSRTSVFKLFLISNVQKEYLRSLFKIHINMNTIYFHNETDDKVHVQLLFEYRSLQTKRTLTFERKISESTGAFLRKLNWRIQEFADKKFKLAQKKAQKCGTELGEPSFQYESCFLTNGHPIPQDTLLGDMLKIANSENVKLRIGESDYIVSFNDPTVIDLTLPKTIRIGCPVTPQTLQTRCCSRDIGEFIWLIKHKKQWIECGTGYSYTPKKEDVGGILKLKCIPKNGSKTGPECEVTCKNSIVEFEKISAIRERQKATSSETETNEIRVVTYNILADVYTGTKEAKNMLFNYCDPEIIDFSYRMGLIFLELEGYHADIFCLQEVDRKFLKGNLDKYFVSKGFRGLYAEKEKAREGCALYYKTSKFEPVAEYHHYLSEQIMENPVLADIKDKIHNNTKLLNRLSAISTLIQILVLKHQKGLLVVGNTHLYFHPDADHIRLLQGIVAFRLLLGKVKDLKEKNPLQNISLIWCGDFNSTPDCGIYKLLTHGSVDCSEVDWKSCPDETITNISFSHTMKMNSACGILPYTNYTNTFKAALDYIFYQTDHLELKNFVPVPSEEVLTLETALPSSYFPSDHIALIADLKWKN